MMVDIFVLFKYVCQNKTSFSFHLKVVLMKYQRKIGNELNEMMELPNEWKNKDKENEHFGWF